MQSRGNPQKQLLLLSDEELMSLYQNGDFSAFEILYGRHSGRVLGYLCKRVAPQIAHELTQEVFVKLHQSRSKYNSEYPFLPWLFTISRNRLTDFFRLNETKLASAVIAESETQLAKLASAPAGSDSFNASLDLSPLTSHQRRAIELRYLQDWSFEKIATDLQTSSINVRQIISRAIKKLKSRLKKGGNHGS